MSDLISRQAAINAVHKEFDDCIVWDESGMTTANEVEKILDSVPSAQPERKKGVWLDDEDDPESVRADGYCGYCSVCKEMSEYLTSYCGNCGADMSGTWNETN